MQRREELTLCEELTAFKQSPSTSLKLELLFVRGETFCSLNENTEAITHYLHT